MNDIIIEDNRFISEYRDKMYIERNNILNEYSKKVAPNQEMVYVYSLSSSNEEIYNLCYCDREKSNIVIQKHKSELPQNTQIGSVLIQNNNQYELVISLTNEINEKIGNMKKQLLNEQTEFLKEKRIEGNIYEISEIGNDRVWLFDVTNQEDSLYQAFEEIDFTNELLENLQEGDLCTYVNGEYVEYK